MLHQRGAGVLMHISSLPSPYGIGVFDRHARDFIDRIADMGFTYWQVLPFNPIDRAGSPYCSPSAFAGNYLFIDPQGLQDMGLATAEEVAANRYDGTPYTADFAFAGERRLALLEQAFLRIDDTLAAKIKAFEVENPWLTDYSVFMAVKEAEGGKPWWQWSDRHAHYHTCIQDIFSYESRAAFWKFVQYIFYQQWGNIKAYANEKGVAVLGDMPIYVAMDSADVWSGLPLFLIDEKTLKPEKVAGVPPDYFSENGQLWGNPVYDWEKLKGNGYAWWHARIDYALTLFDILRIDHFRGFDRFYAIPAGAADAKEGEWLKGPGAALFEGRKGRPIVAEDLGIIDEGVRKMLKETGYPGMKVLEFAFDGNPDNDHKPSHYGENCIAYTGTHDNEPLLSYIEGLDETARRTFEEDLRRECGAAKVPVRAESASALCKTTIRLLFSGKSFAAVVPMNDLLCLGKVARINFPSTVSRENWSYRFKKSELGKRAAEWLKALAEKYQR